MSAEPSLSISSYIPIAPEKFLEKARAAFGKARIDRARLLITAAAMEGSDPLFLLEYQAICGSKVVLRALIRIDGGEYREQLIDAGAEVPEDFLVCLEGEVREQVEDVAGALRSFGIPVETVRTGVQD